MTSNKTFHRAIYKPSLLRMIEHSYRYTTAVQNWINTMGGIIPCIRIIHFALIFITGYGAWIPFTYTVTSNLLLSKMIVWSSLQLIITNFFFPLDSVNGGQFNIDTEVLTTPVNIRIVNSHNPLQDNRNFLPILYILIQQLSSYIYTHTAAELFISWPTHAHVHYCIYTCLQYTQLVKHSCTLQMECIWDHMKQVHLSHYTDKSHKDSRD